MTLTSFFNSKLGLFAKKSNDPTVDAQSNLSPYIHFGQISGVCACAQCAGMRLALFVYACMACTPSLPLEHSQHTYTHTPIYHMHIHTTHYPPHTTLIAQRCAFESRAYRSAQSEGVASFVEQIVIRRELSENYCFFNKVQPVCVCVCVCVCVIMRRKRMDISNYHISHRYTTRNYTLTIHYTLHTTHYILHTAHYILHITNCTLLHYAHAGRTGTIGSTGYSPSSTTTAGLKSPLLCMPVRRWIYVTISVHIHSFTHALTLTYSHTHIHSLSLSFTHTHTSPCVDDKRAYLYSRKQLDESKTHDDLWNAAQKQMVVRLCVCV
jgi:hypothetical protein